MASIINASTSGAGGLISTADNSGILNIQTAGTTAIAINASQAVTLTNALPVASGGTGLTSAGTLGNVLTSNGTTWTSSALPAGGVTSLNGQTGAITNTSLYAIGSYVTGRPKNTTSYAVDSTLAGSSIYATPPGTRWSGTIFAPGANSGLDITASCPLVNTGTWRCVSPAFGDSSANQSTVNGLWVRIS